MHIHTYIHTYKCTYTQMSAAHDVVQLGEGTLQTNIPTYTCTYM